MDVQDILTSPASLLLSLPNPLTPTKSTDQLPDKRGAQNYGEMENARQT